MSYIGQQTNQQSLNGIIDLTDGTIVIQDGEISNVKSLSLNGELNMNTNKIINLDDGVDAGDAVNKSQLDAVSTNLNDYVRRDGTYSMLGNLNLNSYKIVNLAAGTANTDAVNKLQMDNSLNLLRAYVDTQDTADRTYVDSSLNLLRTYVNTQDTALKNYTDSSLNLLRAYVNTQDTADRAYVDASLNLLRSYVDTQDTADRAYVDASLNLKVNRAGDTMTGALIINKTATNYTYTSTTISSVSTITVATGSTIYDFYNINATTIFKLPPQGSTDTFMVGKTMSFNINQTFITAVYLQNNGGTNISINGTTYTNFSTTTSFKLTGTSTVGVYTTSSYIAPPSTTDPTDQLILKSNMGNNYTEFTGIKFLNTASDAGFIRTESDVAHTNSTMSFSVRQSDTIVDALDIGSTVNCNLAMNSRNIAIYPKQETYNAQGGAGFKTRYNYIRFNYGRQWCISPENNDGTLTIDDLIFRNGSGNQDGAKFIIGNSYMFIANNLGIGTTTPAEKLDVVGNFKLSGTILRSSWSSGEIIKNKIYNQNNSATGVLTVGPGAFSGSTLIPNIVTWKTLSFTMGNGTLTDSDIEITIDAPYFIQNYGDDGFVIDVYDLTSTKQTIHLKSQVFNNNSGGGTRSSPMLPLVGTYTPQYATTTAIRTIKVDFRNLSLNDTLKICYISDTVTQDTYTIRITEYRK